MKNGTSIAAVAFLFLYLTVTFREGLASAETERVEDVLKTHVIKKRNAWWSKKSANDDDDDESAHQSVASYSSMHRQPLQKPTPEEIVCYKEHCLASQRICTDSWLSKLLTDDCPTRMKNCGRKCLTRKTGSSGSDGNTPVLY